MKDNKRTSYVIIAILLLVVGISIGYAALTATLTINGNTTIQGNTWDVHFASLSVNQDSTAVPATYADPAQDAPATGEATITNESGLVPSGIQDVEKTKVVYDVTFNKPGDFYEFTVNVVNAGTLPAKLSATPQIISTASEKMEAVMTYSIMDITDEQHPRTLAADDVWYAANDNTSGHSNTKTLKVRVEYDKNKITSNNMLLGPSDSRTATLTFAMNFVQAN